MPADVHATLGASSASRWINCPGSIRLIASLPSSERNRTSTYADEGSAAHALAEKCLRESVPAEKFLGDMIPGKLQKWEVTDEMVEAVQTYLDEVALHVERLGGEVLIEQSVQPLPARDDLFGTADVMIFELYGELVVIDFKYGRGVVVEVDFNDQMMFYALGALEKVGRDDVSKVTIVIVQPRAPHPDGPVRRWSIDVSVLTDFADNLLAAEIRTEDPKAPLKHGEHCRFCSAAAICSELSEQALLTAREDFADLMEGEPTHADVRLPDMNDPVDLARAMILVPVLDFWAREVEGMVHRRLERNEAVPGFKLVRKRANRRWIDSEDVERRLRGKRGVSTDDIYTRKLRSPAQIEKLKKVGKPWVENHAEKPDGGLTVAAESDPRKAVDVPSLLDEFADALND